jgi:hypothetical protein
MADRLLFIGWGSPVRGREERALEVFNETVGLYGRMQQDGRIESFEITLLSPNAILNGFMELKGTAAQMAALREDDEFLRIIADASLIVEDLNVIPGYANQGVATQMGIYAEAIAKVPQLA